MKVKLSDAWLRAMAPPAKGRLEFRDIACPGLVLRLTCSGAASWSARGIMKDGRHGRVTIGTYPEVGLAEARKRALTQRAAIQGGADPVAEKRRNHADAKLRREAPTVAARWQDWTEVARVTAMKGRGWSDAHTQRVSWMLQNVVAPRLGRQPLAGTTRADWTGLVAEAHKRGPAAAGNLLRIASAFLNHAEAAGWIETPLLPRKSSKLAPPVAPRDRVLSDAELKHIWDASSGLSPRTRALVRLLMLTAARRGEVADIALGEIDRSAALWTLPAPRVKNRQPHQIPLGALALAELSAVWPDDAGDLDPSHKVLGRVRGGGFSGFSRAKAKLDQLSGVSEWDWHDLRRTARTGMSRLGVPREAAEAALNHVAGRAGLVGVYDRYDFRPEAMAALTRWQAHVAGLVGAGGEIVPLTERRRAALLA